MAEVKKQKKMPRKKATKRQTKSYQLTEKL